MNIFDAEQNKYRELDLRTFSHILDDPSECYKFYWLEAILDILTDQRDEYSFEEIIDRMIANCWHTVTTYHLWLGPRRAGRKVPPNQLEKVIYTLEPVSTLSTGASAEEVIEELHRHDREVRKYKSDLTLNVPYRLLSQFIPDISGSDKIWGRKEILEVINRKGETALLPYTFRRGTSQLDNRIVINAYWKHFLTEETPILKGWIDYHKVVFLQRRNPAVPGIIYKLKAQGDLTRDLSAVRKLWRPLIETNVILDIYTGRELSPTRFDIDHFIPWSYIANNELWDLIPADPSFNSSKSNTLPDWNTYAERFLDNQYYLYTKIHSDEKMMHLFRKCTDNNLSIQWGYDLMNKPNQTHEEFSRILSENIKPIYDSAARQGFRIQNWQNTIIM